MMIQSEHFSTLMEAQPYAQARCLDFTGSEITRVIPLLRAAERVVSPV